MRRGASILKGISAETDGYAACQRPLNFKRFRLPDPGEGKGRGKRRREVTSAQVPSVTEGRIDPPLTSIYIPVAGTHPLPFIALLISTVSPPSNRIREMRSLRGEKRRYRAAMLLSPAIVYRSRSGRITL